MIGRGAFASLLSALAMATPVAAPALAQTVSDDSARVAVIEQAKRAVVHVVADRSPPTVMAPRSEGGRDKGFAEALEALTRRHGDGHKPVEGSGFVVDPARGLIVTAAHLVVGSPAIRVTLADGVEHRAATAGIDSDSGLALLRIGAMGSTPGLKLDGRATKAGETAIVVGWLLPLRSLLALEGMVTGSAPVEKFDRYESAPLLADYVALDVAIPNGGFGGSPVLDRSGAVVGMVSAIYGRDYGAGSLTLMIPSAQIAPLIEPLAAGVPIRRSIIGIDHDCESPPCRVTAVDPGGPADAAGLKVGDRILSVGSAPVTNSMAMRRAIALTPVGNPLELRIHRSGQLMTLVARTVAGP